MPRRPGEQPQQQEVTPGIKRWVWSDGTPLEDDELVAAGVQNWDFGRSAESGIDEVSHALGFNPGLIDPGAPGASLETAQADAQRNRLGGEIARLTQQAATGDGAWQQAFTDAVQRTQANAQALGQSDANVDYGDALMNIGNAQAGVAQRAVNDEGMLREQSKLDARGQLADVLGTQAQADIGQSAEQARIRREVNAANQASIEATRKNRQSTESAVGGGLMSGMGMSDGGQVPGRPRVFGDDSRNDTVPAMLSPGEIVVPISKADDPSEAARFARAVAENGGAKGYAEGGGIKKGKATDLGPEGWLTYLINPQMGRDQQYKKMREKYGADSGGGELDLGQFRETTGQQDALASLFAGQAMGSGPSIVPMQFSKATNENMGAAVAAQAQGRMPAGDIVQTASAAGSEVAADAGRGKAIEQSRGQNAYTRAVQQRRAQELQASSAQQQAQFGKLQQDLGLSLEQQSQLRGALGAAGQGAAAFSASGRRNNGSQSSGDIQDTNYLPEEGAGPEYRPDELAFGGMVGNYAGGGKVKLKMGDVTMKPNETAVERGQRKWAEYEEETGMSPDTHKPRTKKGDESESRFVRAVRDAMGRAGGIVKGFAEGGGVPDGGGYTPFDPYKFDVQRGSQPIVYVSPTPVPGTQPVPLGGAGGGGGQDMPSGAGGGAPDMGASAAGGASGAMQVDRGSGGATGGPAGNQIPQQEAIQPRAERPIMGALPPGVAPKGAAGEQPVPPPKPEAAHAPRGGVSRPSGSAADEMARKAALAQYEADNQATVAASEAAAAEANAVESAANERKAVVQRTQARVAESQTRYQRAVDEMSRIDTSVEPGRFWASRTTGDKVIGILGLVLGALGAGPDGINRAAVMLNDAVNRDLEAQKSEHELRLKKGGARINAAQNFYAMARDIAGDELAATDLAHAAALQSVVAKGKALMAQTQDAQAKARLAGVIASIEQGASARAAGAWEKAADRQIERDKIHAASGKDATAANDLRNAVAANASIEQLVGDLKGLIGDTNIVTEKYGERAGRMESIAGQLVTKIKEQEHLGAYDNGTAKLAERIIGDPNATFTLDTTKIAKLDTLLKQSRRDVRNLAGAMR